MLSREYVKIYIESLQEAVEKDDIVLAQKFSVKITDALTDIIIMEKLV